MLFRDATPPRAKGGNFTTSGFLLQLVSGSARRVKHTVKPHVRRIHTQPSVADTHFDDKTTSNNWTLSPTTLGNSKHRQSTHSGRTDSGDAQLNTHEVTYLEVPRPTLRFSVQAGWVPRPRPRQRSAHSGASTAGLHKENTNAPITRSAQVDWPCKGARFANDAHIHAEPIINHPCGVRDAIISAELCSGRNAQHNETEAQRAQCTRPFQHDKRTIMDERTAGSKRRPDCAEAHALLGGGGGNGCNFSDSSDDTALCVYFSSCSSSAFSSASSFSTASRDTKWPSPFACSAFSSWSM